MSDQKMEINVDEKKEIDLNKEFDPVAKIMSLESENESLLKKVDMLEATHKVDLEAKDKEIANLKQQLEEQDERWKTRKDFFEWRSMTWRKGIVEELQTKISELENKLKILENASPQKVVDEKEQVGGSSSGANEDA